MTVIEIAQFLCDNGVTVGMLVVLCFYVNKLTESHKEEVDGMKEMLHELKETLISLTNKIDSINK